MTKTIYQRLKPKLKKTLDEIKSKTRFDNNVVRYLTVKYKKLDLKTEYFSKSKI